MRAVHLAETPIAIIVGRAKVMVCAAGGYWALTTVKVCKAPRP
jgi:hypothetical protein